MLFALSINQQAIHALTIYNQNFISAHVLCLILIHALDRLKSSTEYLFAAFAYISKSSLT